MDTVTVSRLHCDNNTLFIAGQHWIFVIIIPFSLQDNTGFQSVNNERKRLHFEPRHNNLKVDVSIIHILSI